MFHVIWLIGDGLLRVRAGGSTRTAIPQSREFVERILEARSKRRRLDYYFRIFFWHGYRRLYLDLGEINLDEICITEWPTRTRSTTTPTTPSPYTLLYIKTFSPCIRGKHGI